MLSCALIGPDGAGKTTVCKRLEDALPLRARYIYMGVSLDSSNRMLPTTRGLKYLKRAIGAPKDNRGPLDPAALGKPTDRGLKALARAIKNGVGLANRIGEEWYRQALACYYQRRGEIVLFDRHFYADFYAYDIAPRSSARSLGRRIHGSMLERLFPKPDLVVYLDAPAEVLLSRKGEGSLDLLERRRRDYLDLGKVLENFTVIDASRPEDEVARDVADTVIALYEQRRARQDGERHAS